MNDITKNEMNLLMAIFKNPGEEYNANSISKKLGISSMGALKIATRLEKENLLISKEMGKATFYRLNTSYSYLSEYIKFLLQREAEQAQPYVKRWITEIRKIKTADAAILFGSVLKKQKEANDIDVLFIVEKEKYGTLSKEIENISRINDKKIHPMYQTRQDFTENIKAGDKPLLNAIKGIILFGEGLVVELLK